MTQFLPPNLLALFAPRDPIPYLPPAAKLPHEKNTAGYSGVSQFMTDFEVKYRNLLKCLSFHTWLGTWYFFIDQKFFILLSIYVSQIKISVTWSFALDWLFLQWSWLPCTIWIQNSSCMCMPVLLPAFPSTLII